MYDHTDERTGKMTNNRKTPCMSSPESHTRQEDKKRFIYTRILAASKKTRRVNKTLAIHPQRKIPKPHSLARVLRETVGPAIHRLYTRCQDSSQSRTLYPYLPFLSCPFSPSLVVASTCCLQLLRQHRGTRVQRLRYTRLLACLQCLL